MRKRYRVMIFAALVAALVVPVGYALSVESMPTAAPSSYATAVPSSPLSSVAAAVVMSAPITVSPTSGVSTPSLAPASDAAKLFGIGTVLFGLAAFLRKAS